MSMNIDDIPQGESWAVTYWVECLVDPDGNPTQARHLGERITATIGRRTGIGIIKTRDRTNRLLELIDSETGATVVVGYDQTERPEPVEWQDR